MKIVIATHNNDKLKELLKAFNHHFEDIDLLTLNDFPEFEGLNPSLENFCRIIGDMFCNKLSVLYCINNYKKTKTI